MEALFFGANASVYLQNFTRSVSKRKTISIPGHFVQLRISGTTKFSCLEVEAVSARRAMTLDDSSAEFRKEVEDRFAKAFGEEKWKAIIRALTIPPAWTCIRISYASRDAIIAKLQAEVDKFNAERAEYALRLGNNELAKSKSVIRPHEVLSDCVRLEFARSTIDMASAPPNRVIVDTKCGEAVLRGADVFAPGIKAATAGLMENEFVSVFIDIDSVTLYGDKDVSSAEESGRRLLFIGLGVTTQSRAKMFVVDRKGVAVKMVQRPRGDSPSLNNVMEGEIFLQNLPSALVAIVLNPQPGELILDMCSSPGGKTSHIQDLMRDQGLVVACDRTVPKCVPVRSCCDAFANKRGVQSIVRVCQSNSASKQVASNVNLSNAPFEVRKQAVEAHLAGLKMDDQRILVLPPGTLPRGSFDKVLLDGPCSSLGLRPRFSHIDATNKSLDEMAQIQKRMLYNALHLVKLGGVIVYSTCTFNPGENEEVIQWALSRYPSIVRLLPAEPRIGQVGLSSVLGPVEAAKVQRFDPSDLVVDSIGFFIARLEKIGDIDDSTNPFGY